VFAVPGALFAALMVGLTPTLEPFFEPRLQFQVGLDPGADLRVVGFTTLVAVFAVAAFGLIPALRLARPNLVASLSSVIGERRTHRAPVRLRGFLVVSQLAMSVILLVAGTLFVRSLVAARQADVGFDTTNRLLVSVNVGLQGYDSARGRRFYDDVVTRVREIQGVVSASWVFPVPFDTHGRTLPFYVEGLRTNAETPTVRADVSIVGENFVSALGLRLLGGRTFARTDSATAPEVMIVSRSLANRFWPGKDPVGQRIRRNGADGPEVTVVGIVADAKFATLGYVNDRRAYLPLRQQHRDWQTLVVHVRGEPRAMLPAIRRVVASTDPSLPTFGVSTMTESVESSLSTSRTSAAVAGFFGACALLIAAVGLYAVVAGGVAERTREIGVRQALGATPAAVLRFVMLGGARLGTLGLAIGLVAAFGAARGMRGLLVGLSPSDPLTFALVPLVLGLVVVIATYLPARRAVKLDPVAALRSD
jgi:predicted permease